MKKLLLLSLLVLFGCSKEDNSAEITQYENQILSLTNQISSLQNNIVDLNNQINSINLENANYSNELNSVTQLYNDLQNSFSNLQNNYNSIVNSNSSLSNQIDDLTTLNETLTNENYSLSTQISNLSLQVNSLLSDAEESNSQETNSNTELFTDKSSGLIFKPLGVITDTSPTANYHWILSNVNSNPVPFTEVSFFGGNPSTANVTNCRDYIYFGGNRSNFETFNESDFYKISFDLESSTGTKRISVTFTLSEDNSYLNVKAEYIDGTIQPNTNSSLIYNRNYLAENNSPPVSFILSGCN